MAKTPAQTHEVTPEQARGALDGVVRAAFEKTWGQARELIARGKIRLDGQVATSNTTRVRAGQVIELVTNAPNPKKAQHALTLQDAIVHVDGHVVVVKKPSGISTIPYEENERGTLDELVRAYLARLPGQQGRPNLGVVHRLDKETTGLLVFTRSWLAKKSLATQFRFHTVHRKYLAIVHGHPRPGTITSTLLEDRGDGLRGSIERTGRKPRGNEGQKATTHVRVIEKLRDAALVECTLETGRTHQIRIHLSEDGHPVLGERVYIRDFRGAPLPAPRVMLHAAELGFVHPKTEAEVHFTMPLPSDMEAVLAMLRD